MPLGGLLPYGDEEEPESGQMDPEFLDRLLYALAKRPFAGSGANEIRENRAQGPLLPSEAEKLGDFPRGLVGHDIELPAGFPPRDEPAPFQAGGGLDNPFPNVDMLTDPSGARLQMLGTPPGGPVGPEQGPQESDLAKVLTWLSKSKRR